jgi:hypothetical protein
MNAGQAIACANEWVAAHGTQIPGFRGAHLMGSVLSMPHDAVFPTYRDVDFNIVCEGSHDTQTHNVPYKGLMLEYSVVNLERYRSAEEVLANPELACNLAIGGLLADPLGLLAPLQRAVADQYGLPRWVQARCAYEKQIVHQALDNLGQAGTPFEALLPLGTLGLFLSGLLAEASLQPPTHRRCLVVMRDVLHSQGCVALYETVLNVIGYGQLSRYHVDGYLDACAAAFDCAAAVTRTPVMFQFKFQPHIRPCIVEGAREMVDQGYHREAMFWIGGFLMFANAAIQADAPAQERSVFQSSLDRLIADMGLRTSADVAARVAAAHDLVEAMFAVADELTEHIPA